VAGRRHILRSPSAALAALPAAFVAAWPSVVTAQPPPRGDATLRYVIECPEPESAAPTCTADLVTYVGWRVFVRHCASCHGDDAEGSTFAPSLVLRLQRFDRRAFDRALDEGYAGPFAPMRPWGEHPQVARYYDELWTYLSARTNGDLPAVPLLPRNERPAETPVE
jgi:mono/diheme cytochrome c family protein